MNLHHDHEAFSEFIIAASNELHIPAGIIEKDYYVTLALRELASRIKGMVFKGGTSLTKCYQILDRFSEDIVFPMQHQKVFLAKAANGS